MNNFAHELSKTWIWNHTKAVHLAHHCAVFELSQAHTWCGRAALMTARALIDTVALRADVKYLTFKAHPADVLRKGLSIWKPFGQGFLQGVSSYACPPLQRDFAQGLLQLQSDQLLPCIHIPLSPSAPSVSLLRPFRQAPLTVQMTVWTSTPAYRNRELRRAMRGRERRYETKRDG